MQVYHCPDCDNRLIRDFFDKEANAIHLVCPNCKQGLYIPKRNKLIKRGRLKNRMEFEDYKQWIGGDPDRIEDEDDGSVEYIGAY